MPALKIILPIYLVLFVLGGFRNIKLFLLLTGIVTMPFRTTYTILDIGPYIGWTNGIVIALSDVSFICLFIYLVVTGKKLGGFSKKLTKPALFFIAALIPSLANSTWVRLSLFEVVLLLQAFFLYYIVLTSAIETERELRLVIMMLMLSLILQGGFGVAQYLTGHDLDVFATGTPVTEESAEGLVTRALGTIGKPNGLAMYLVPLILLFTAMIMRMKGVLRKVGILSISAGGLALIFSFSRGGWMAFAAAFLVLLFMLKKRRYVSARPVFLAIVVAVLVTALFYPQIHDRLVSEEGADAAVDRIYLIKIAWNMIKSSPFIGIGANTFMSVINNYTRGPDLQDIYLHMVHNQYLLVFAETGLVGIIAFLWFLFACFRESWECSHGRSELSRIIGISAGAGFLAMAAHMMVDMYSSPLCIGLLFVFCSLCAAAKKVQGAPKAEAA